MSAILEEEHFVPEKVSNISPNEIVGLIKRGCHQKNPTTARTTPPTQNLFLSFLSIAGWGT